jgi:hypothetical protein
MRPSPLQPSAVEPMSTTIGQSLAIRAMGKLAQGRCRRVAAHDHFELRLVVAATKKATPAIAGVGEIFGYE